MNYSFIYFIVLRSIKIRLIKACSQFKDCCIIFNFIDKPSISWLLWSIKDIKCNSDTIVWVNYIMNSLKFSISLDSRSSKYSISLPI
ncbi:unnamed protein product [Paramecium sonneborni]|uniref:Uncharacterized protein n=1 Tax=Paramecium sonneborni TaxID=65129 RepID=A0A8S1RX78_9CILI|nr:unnamed protein product [Paramecium sonneborni]